MMKRCNGSSRSKISSRTALDGQIIILCVTSYGRIVKKLKRPVARVR